VAAALIAIQKEKFKTHRTALDTLLAVRSLLYLSFQSRLGDNLGYNIHDMANEPCRCGRSLPRLSQLAGRLTDLFVTVDGRWLTVHLACFFRAMNSVEAFQIVQKDVQNVLVKLVVKDDFSDAEHRSTVDSLRACMGEDCRVTVDVVGDEILPTSAGKRLYFISEVIQSTNRTWSDRNA